MGEHTGKMRWRMGDRRPVMAAVDETVRVRIGDLLWYDVDDAKPARELALHLAEPYTPEQLQERFARLFLGVAMQQSPAGESAAIRVATAGVFTFDSAVGRAALGQLVGADVSGDGTVLRDDRVVLVRHRARAFARVWRREEIYQPYVLVEIFSQVMAPLVPADER